MLPRVLLWAMLMFVAGVSQSSAADPFDKSNLVAWCIVPFDSQNRTPEQRAAMLAKLGFRRFAYDWRDSHLVTFDRELAALDKHKIELTAIWFPGGLNKEGRFLLDRLAHHKLQTQLWLMLSEPAATLTQDQKLQVAIKQVRPVAEEAAKRGHRVALYNHGGWGGEPENQIAVIQGLGRQEVGLVYNLHHGHSHLERFPRLVNQMKPHLLALNLNGMVARGDQLGEKILPLGQGTADLQIMKTIRDTGLQIPIGILGHTEDDAEARLQDNLDGLNWLRSQLEGGNSGPRPAFRTWPKNK